MVSGAEPEIAGYSFDSVAGERALNANPYAAGPSNPFGPITTDDAQMTLSLEYLVVH